MNKRPSLPVSIGRFSRMSRLAAGMAGVKAIGREAKAVFKPGVELLPAFGWVV